MAVNIPPIINNAEDERPGLITLDKVRELAAENSGDASNEVVGGQFGDDNLSLTKQDGSSVDIDVPIADGITRGIISGSEISTLAQTQVRNGANAATQTDYGVVTEDRISQLAQNRVNQIPLSSVAGNGLISVSRVGQIASDEIRGGANAATATQHGTVRLDELDARYGGGDTGWQEITLLGDWLPQSSSIITGPQYRLRRGLLHLRGRLEKYKNQSGPSPGFVAEDFAELPFGIPFRSAHIAYGVRRGATAAFDIQVQETGRIRMRSLLDLPSSWGGRWDQLSLDGITIVVD